MKKYIYSLLAAFVMSACVVSVPHTYGAPAKKVNVNDVVKIIMNTKLTPSYVELEIVTSNTKTQSKRWDNMIKTGQYREDSERGGLQAVFISEKKKTYLQVTGRDPIESDAGLTVSPNDAKPVIKEMKEATTLAYGGKSNC